MKIAFDVKGTLDGYHREKVLKLFRWFESQGHEMFVWSNVGSYAVDAVEELKLNAEAMWKDARNDFMELDKPTDRYMDIAVEDDTDQTWLAAKKFIWVHEIPDDEKDFPKLLEKEDHDESSY